MFVLAHFVIIFLLITSKVKALACLTDLCFVAKINT